MMKLFVGVALITLSFARVHGRSRSDITVARGSISSITTNNPLPESTQVEQNKTLQLPPRVNSSTSQKHELHNEHQWNSSILILRHRKLAPLLFPRFRRTIEDKDDEECNQSIDDFPHIFTGEQIKAGAVGIAFLVGVYCFTLLATVCDSYFLPCVERICEDFNISKDVAAATFMSMATSAPELFVNIIGTFITESDIGIGTVVGSSMFNSLGVAALGSIAATRPIQLDWWPVTRDSIVYIFAITLLVAITWNGSVQWYESLVLFVAYFLYFVLMFNNEKIGKHVKGFVNTRLAKKTTSTEILTKPDVQNNKKTSTLTISRNDTIYYVEEPVNKYTEANDEIKSSKKDDEDSVHKLWSMPKGSCLHIIYFIYSWPIRFALHCTIPDPNKYPRLFPVTFIMCILWIGTNSYVVSWMITVIGFALGISEAILGLTFLAAGGCLPEAVSIIIMSRRGEGSMGVSNSLGANTMNILLSLGLPWFIKTMIMGANGSSMIIIDSGAIEYFIIALTLVAVALFITLACNKFRLSKTTGIVLIFVYLVFLSLAIVTEYVFVGTQQEC